MNCGTLRRPNWRPVGESSDGWCRKLRGEKVLTYREVGKRTMLTPFDHGSKAHLQLMAWEGSYEQALVELISGRAAWYSDVGFEQRSFCNA